MNTTEDALKIPKMSRRSTERRFSGIMYLYLRLP